MLFFTIPTTIFPKCQTQTTGTTENPRTIYFINLHTVYEGTKNGRLLKTLEGGISSGRLNPGISQRINSVYYSVFILEYTSSVTN